MYIIIVGLGGIGQNLARIAVSEKHNVVVIDTDRKRCDDAVTKYDLISVNGDATSSVILDEAGISEADAVISATGSDAVNLMVMLQAKEKGVKNLRTIVNEPDHVEFFKKMGVIMHKNPDAIVAEDIYNTMLRPSASDFIPVAGGRAEIVEILIKDQMHAVGKRIADIGLPANVLVIAIERGDDVVIPDDNTILQAGDSVLVFIRKSLFDRIFKLFSIGNLVK